MNRVTLRTAETTTHDRHVDLIQTWVAEYGEITGVGTTEAAALRDLADRLDVEESVHAERPDKMLVIDEGVDPNAIHEAMEDSA